MIVAQIDDEQRRTYRLPDEVDGLVVTDVASDSPYQERFHAGMVIIQLNRAPVDDVAGARSKLRTGGISAWSGIAAGIATFRSRMASEESAGADSGKDAQGAHPDRRSGSGRRGADPCAHVGYPM